MRVIVSGYYGSGNTGDEAVLEGIIAGARAAAGAVEFTVLSHQPDATARAHGVDSIGRFDFSALGRRLADSDLFISGGGNLFQDATSARSCLYYLFVVRQALKAGVPVMALGQGIGPLRRRWLRGLVRGYLNRVQGIAVRDSESARELERMGVTAMVRIAADLSLVMKPASAQEVAQAYCDLGERGANAVLAVAPRTWRIRGLAAEFLPRLASAIKLAAARMQPAPRIIFFPMQRPHDDEGCRALAEDVGGLVEGDQVAPAVVAGMIGRARAVVGMRLHALIFAALGASPPVAVSYDPKVGAFMNDIGLGAASSVSNVDEGGLASAIAAAWDADDEARAVLRGRIEQSREVVRDVFRWAAQVARNR